MGEGTPELSAADILASPLPWGEGQGEGRFVLPCAIKRLCAKGGDPFFRRLVHCSLRCSLVRHRPGALASGSRLVDGDGDAKSRGEVKGVAGCDACPSLISVD